MKPVASAGLLHIAKTNVRKYSRHGSSKIQQEDLFMVFDYFVFDSCLFPEGLFTCDDNSPVTNIRTNIILY